MDNRGEPLPTDHPFAGTTVIVGGLAGFDPRTLLQKRTPASERLEPQPDVAVEEIDRDGPK